MLLSSAPSRSTKHDMIEESDPVCTRQYSQPYNNPYFELSYQSIQNALTIEAMMHIPNESLHPFRKYPKANEIVHRAIKQRGLRFWEDVTRK